MEKDTGSKLEEIDDMGHAETKVSGGMRDS